MQNNGKLVLSSVLLLGMPLLYGSSVYAATAIDLSHKNAAILQPYVSSTAMKGTEQLRELNRSVDFNQTLHVRVQETFSGYPIIGADAVIHVPNGSQSLKNLADIVSSAQQNQGSLDGTLYQNISSDLAGTPASVFTQAQSQQALQLALETFQHNAGGKAEVKDQTSQLVVFLDKAGKAHWAYEVSFYALAARDGLIPSKPVYLMDAISFKVYAQWDNIKTAKRVSAEAGGGFGGNLKMGKIVYDGLASNLAKLQVTRDGDTCSLTNDDVTVKGFRTRKIETYDCKAGDPDHANVYWDGEQHAVNGGYSPDNDALFGGWVIKNMYKEWYGVPVLTNRDGTPMMLNMVVHDPIDNAYWDGTQMTFGDGVNMFYPLTSLGVAAHEISHGFTEQHSNLTYWGQSGGMNEAFSDMAAQGAEMYAYGKNSWQIGPEIFKKENQALRYMDKPSKDCNGKTPGSWCSIDDASQYYDGLDVHFSSGVYNRFFYSLGTAKGWTVKKAFDVMVQANAHYWTSNTNFKTGACGVIKATKDLKFKVASVKAAFKKVKIDTSGC